MTPQSAAGRCKLRTPGEMCPHRPDPQRESVHTHPTRTILGMSSNQFTPQRSLRLACVALLVAGFVAAAWIFIATMNVDSSNNAASLQATSIRLDQNRREMEQVARLGGKITVMTVQFHQWFLSLWEGRPLAYTLIVLAVASAWLCWHIAELMDDEQDT